MKRSLDPRRAYWRWRGHRNASWWARHERNEKILDWAVPLTYVAVVFVLPVAFVISWFV